MFQILEGVTEKPTVHEATLSRTVVTETCENVIAAIFNELPKELHTIEVFNYILSQSKEMLNSKVRLSSESWNEKKGVSEGEDRHKT